LQGMINWSDKKELASRSFRSMGGLAAVTLSASSSDRIESITAQVRTLFEQLEKDLSTYRPDSVISQLAEKAEVAPLAVPDDAFRLLGLGKHYGELSDGAFDITIPPLARPWGFGRVPEPPAVPTETAIQETRKLVDYRRLVLAEGTAFLPLKGMAVDLGGIVKGYAVDRAFDLCRRAGIEDFLIDLRGNIRTNGRPRWREKWQIGVRDPFDSSRIIGKVSLQNGMALATSGSYERFVEITANTTPMSLTPGRGTL